MTEGSGAADATAASPGTAADRSSRSLLAVTAFGYGSVFLGLALVSPLLPTISESLRLTPLGAGVALSLLWGVRAASQYPSGRLSDELSRKTLLVAGLACALVGVGLLTAAPAYPAFLLAVAVLGLGNGLYPPAGIALVSERFAARKGQALGVLIGTADLAGAAAGMIAVGLAAAASWRVGFLPVAAALAIAAALTHRVNREPYARPRRVRLELRSTGRRLLGDPHRRLVVAGFALWMVAFQGAVSFLPTFLVAEKAASLELAGGGFALLWGVGALVKPAAGRLGDRVGHLPVAAGTLAVSAAGLVGLLLAVEAAAVVAWVVVFAAGLLATTPMVWAHVAAVSPDASVGGDVGALRTVFEGVGSLGPLLVGLAAERAGYLVGFAGLAGCLAAATGIVAWLAVRERYNVPPPHRAEET